MAVWLLRLRDEALRGASQPPSVPGSISSSSPSTRLSMETACTVTLVVDDSLRVVDMITRPVDLDPDFLSSRMGKEYVHLYWAILCQLAPDADWGAVDGAKLMMSNQAAGAIARERLVITLALLKFACAQS